MRGHVQNLGTIGSAVLTFIGYKQTDKPNLYLRIKIFQNCFLGKIVAGVLGKQDPDFSSFQNLLAISELVHGWIKNRLCAETETYLTTCRKYKGRVLYGIKTPEE